MRAEEDPDGVNINPGVERIDQVRTGRRQRALEAPPQKAWARTVAPQRQATQPGAGRDRGVSERRACSDDITPGEPDSPPAERIENTDRCYADEGLDKAFRDDVVSHHLRPA